MAGLSGAHLDFAGETELVRGVEVGWLWNVLEDGEDAGCGGCCDNSYIVELVVIWLVVIGLVVVCF